MAVGLAARRGQIADLAPEAARGHRRGDGRAGESRSTICGLPGNQQAGLAGYGKASERMAEFTEHLDLGVGQEWTVVLPGLDTAGYMWQERVSGPPDVIRVSWVRGFAPGTGPAVVGVSAPEQATVRAVAPGDVMLRLVQVRPWQPDATPIGERRVTVRVCEADAAR